MTWFNWYDVDLCFSHWCGVTGVLPGLESSPWFLPLGKVYTHRAPLHTTTYHYSPLPLHTTIFDSTQFYTKYIYLQWHFTALSTMHLFTPLLLQSLNTILVYIPSITFTLHYTGIHTQYYFHFTLYIHTRNFSHYTTLFNYTPFYIITYSTTLYNYKMSSTLCCQEKSLYPTIFITTPMFITTYRTPVYH